MAIMCQFNKFEQAAIAVAIASKGVGGSHGRRFRVGAVISEKERVVTARFNSYKTHPILREFTQYPYLHAEQSAIFSLGWRAVQGRQGLKLWVARIHKDHTLALAKPCSVCQSILARTQIQEVYYSTSNGDFQRL
jgi:deoxycytidylate deaminase